MKISITLESMDNGVKSICSTEMLIDSAFDGEEKPIMAWLNIAIKDYTKHGGINGMLEGMNKDEIKKVRKDPTDEWNNDI